VNLAPSAVPVGRAERQALLAAAAACFFLMGGYYVLRPIREALALEVGVRNNFQLFLMVLAASCVMLPVYWWLVSRTPRTRLLWIVNVVFALAFISLAFGLDAMPRNRVLAAVYFVTLTTFNLLLIAVFWSAMSDVWRPELAKRFYGYVGGGRQHRCDCGKSHRARAGDQGRPAAAHRRRLPVDRVVGCIGDLRARGPAAFLARPRGTRWRHPGRR
jgi:ATP/ADP translocase